MTNQVCSAIGTCLSPDTYVAPADIIQRTCDLALTWPQNILNAPILDQTTTLASLPLERVSGLSSWVCIYKTFRDWIKPDDDGKMLWEKDRPTFYSMVFLSLGRVANQTCKLDSIHKVVSLGKYLSPLKTASDVFFVGYCFFDLIASTRSIAKNEIKMGQALTRKLKLIEGRDIKADGALGQPKEFSLPKWNAFVQKQFDKWTTISNGHNMSISERQKCERKRAEWIVIKNTTQGNVEAAKRIYQRKIERRTVQEENAKIAISQSWWSRVFDISLVAVIALSYLAAMPFITASAGIVSMAVLAALPVVDFATAILDLGTCADGILRQPKPDVVVIPQLVTVE